MWCGDDDRVAGLPEDVRVAVDGYLAEVDDVANGFVESLYVTGSIALDDYRPPISDVDLVAVCRRRPSRGEIAALSALHRPSKPSVDVLYATREDLGRDPSGLSLPGSVGGEFRPDGAFEANPVVWRVLSTRAIAVRGDPLGAGDVWFDADTLRRWNLANLDSYWSEWLERARAHVPTEDRVRSEYGLRWLVLGIPRLHYTVATLDVTSKTGGGRHALDVVPTQWHAVVTCAIALRADRQSALPAPCDELWSRACDVSAWLIEDAHRLADVPG